MEPTATERLRDALKQFSERPDGAVVAVPLRHLRQLARESEAVAEAASAARAALKRVSPQIVGVLPRQDAEEALQRLDRLCQERLLP